MPASTPVIRAAKEGVRPLGCSQGWKYLEWRCRRRVLVDAHVRHGTPVSSGRQGRVVAAVIAGVEKGLQRLLHNIRGGGPWPCARPLVLQVARSLNCRTHSSSGTELAASSAAIISGPSVAFYRTLFWRSSSVFIVSTWLPKSGSLLAKAVRTTVGNPRAVLKKVRPHLVDF